MRTAALAIGSILSMAAGVATDLSTDTTKGVVDVFLSHGTMGAVAIILLVAYIRKEKQLDQVRDALLALAEERRKDEQDRNDVIERAREQTAKMQVEATAGMSKMSDVCDRLVDELKERRIRDEAANDAKRTQRTPVQR